MNLLGLEVPELHCTLGTPQQHLVQVGARVGQGREVKGGWVKGQAQVLLWSIGGEGTGMRTRGGTEGC